MKARKLALQTNVKNKNKKQIKTLKSQNQKKKKKKLSNTFFGWGQRGQTEKKKIDPLKYLSAISVQNLEVESSQYSSTVRMSDTS